VVFLWSCWFYRYEHSYTGKFKDSTGSEKIILDEALKVAFRAGAVMGLTVVGLGLLDITVWFFILRLFYQMIFT